MKQITKIAKAEYRRRALAAWWDREPWPAVILAVDPGETFGAAIVVSRPRAGFDLVRCEAASIYDVSERLEWIVDAAVETAVKEGLPLVGVLEDWGSGGPRGLAQWIGLGEKRGPWRRRLILTAKDPESPLTRKAAGVHVTQSRWRSRVIDETGTQDAAGRWQPFGPAGWKGVALRAAQDLYPSAYVPPLDAAEAACIGAYAVRSDEVGKILGKRHLAHFGLAPFRALENAIKRGLALAA